MKYKQGDVIECWMTDTCDWHKGRITELGAGVFHEITLNSGLVLTMTEMGLRPFVGLSKPDGFRALDHDDFCNDLTPPFQKRTTTQSRVEACDVVLSSLVPSFDPETPSRMARGLGDLVTGYADDIEAMLKTFPVEGDNGIVCVRGIPFASLCEHHVLPFTGTVAVVYLPSDRVVGLSKIPRLVRSFTRRLQLQERIGVQISDALMLHAKARGVMVVVRGRHSCMALRGAECPAEMVTSCVRGTFASDAPARAEALELIR